MSSHAHPRGAARLAWGLTLLGLILLGALILIAVADHTSMSRFVSDNSFVVVFAVVFPFTGALVASRHPRNAVGWLMIGAPVFSILLTGSHAYARHALVISPGSWPGGDVASWITAWSWVPMLGMASLLLLLLPDGRLVSRR